MYSWLDAQVLQVTIVHIPLVVDKDPPHGVRGDSIHLAGQFGDVPDQVEAFGHHFVVTEYR